MNIHFGDCQQQADLSVLLLRTLVNKVKTCESILNLQAPSCIFTVSLLTCEANIVTNLSHGSFGENLKEPLLKMSVEY